MRMQKTWPLVYDEVIASCYPQIFIVINNTG